MIRENGEMDVEKRQLIRATADDLQVKNPIKNDLDQNDHYALNCGLRNHNMKLEHNIHTINLLFQVYKCPQCSIIDRELVVRDKEKSESVVEKSKGMNKHNAIRLRILLLSSITSVSNHYFNIVSISPAIKPYIDPYVDLLIADKTAYDQYQAKLRELRAAISKVTNNGSRISTFSNVNKSIRSGDNIAINHKKLYLDAKKSYSTIRPWLYELGLISRKSLVTSMISYLYQVYIDKVTGNELDYYTELVEMLLKYAFELGDLFNDVLEGKRGMPEYFHEKRNIDFPDQMTYEQIRRLLDTLINEHLLNISDGTYRLKLVAYEDLNEIFDTKRFPTNESDSSKLSSHMYVLSGLTVSIIKIMEDQIECIFDLVNVNHDLGRLDSNMGSSYDPRDFDPKSINHIKSFSELSDN